MLTIKAKGQSGSWFATLETGEIWPCVHKKWWPSGNSYCDPTPTPGVRKWDEFVAAIEQGKRVILTEEDAKKRRKEYRHAWRVDNVKTDNGKLTFDFIEKLFNVERGKF